MDHGPPDIRRFIDVATLSALGAFADAVETNPRRFRHVWFDLAGVWTDKNSAADKQALVALIRRIGIEHFLPASDWPYNGDNLADYYDRVYPELPLTQREWAIILERVSDFVPG